MKKELKIKFEKEYKTYVNTFNDTEMNASKNISDVFLEAFAYGNKKINYK